MVKQRNIVDQANENKSNHITYTEAHYLCCTHTVQMYRDTYTYALNNRIRRLYITFDELTCESFKGNYAEKKEPNERTERERERKKYKY